MTAALKNFVIEQEADFVKVLTFRQGSGVPVDLTGCSASMQVRDSTGKLLLELSSWGTGIVVEAAGVITLQMSSNETGSLTFRNGQYDLVLRYAGGRVQRLMQGIIEVSPGQTRVG